MTLRVLLRGSAPAGFLQGSDEPAAPARGLESWLEARFGGESWLFEPSFVLENWQWLGIVALVVLCVVLERVFTKLLFRFARRLTKTARLQLDSERLAGFERPFSLLVIAAIFLEALPLLGLKSTVGEILDIAASFGIAFASVWAALRLVDLACDFLRVKASESENKFDDMLVPLLRRTLKILVVIVGVVFVASKLTENLWTIVTGLSIGSLAVGFAAKDSIENLLGTFSVLLDKPFQLGDWITVGDVDGTVEHVGIRSTRVRTFYNSIITVPNSRFISAHVDNWGARRYRRIKTMLSLTYDTPPEKIEAFCEGVRQLILVHPYTRKDSFYVYLNQMSASSLDVLLYTFVEVPDWGTELRERHRLFADILRLAERLNVSFAFPTQTLHVARPEDLVHDDRPADDRTGAERGREAAREVARESLKPYAGQKPKPFSIKPAAPLFDPP